MSTYSYDPLLQLSTGTLPVVDRYEYWRESVFGYFDCSAPEPGEKKTFQGNVISLLNCHGEVHDYRSSAMSGRRTRSQYRADGGDDIAVSYMVTGSAVYEPEGDAPIVAAQGRFFCYDSARPSRLACTDNRQLNFALPRGAVIQAIGGPVPEPSMLTRVLNQSRLAPYLLVQMRRLTRDAPNLSVFERNVMLNATLGLACSVLRGAFHPDGAPPVASHDAGLYAAACQYLDTHLGKADLTAADVAAALNCSRAHLYRVFARHGMTVADRLRESRLRLARRMLEGEPLATVGIIAWRCGYADASAFGRAFGRRHGCSPREWRARIGRLSG